MTYNAERIVCAYVRACVRACVLGCLLADVFRKPF